MTGDDRPLPQPTLATAAFWSSGADGTLRMSRCSGCRRWFHPPMPCCPTCGSTEIGLEPTSGRGTVVAVTVTRQAWLRSFPPPFAIAIVAIEESPEARLTTNVVGCPPDDVRIGMRVRVRFDHRPSPEGDVWIPDFEPDPDTEREQGPGPLPEPRDLTPALRRTTAAGRATRFEDRVALTGVGQSRVGRRLMVDPLALTVEACRAAVADAGLTLADIDGLSTYPGPSAHIGMTEGGVTPVSQALGLAPVWVNGAGEVPGQSGSIITAMLAVASGLCRHVLCFRTVWESSLTALQRSGRWAEPQARATGLSEWRLPFGASSAAQWIGMHASHYLHRYAVGREVFGHIAVTARAGAARNPEAVYREPITLDDYFAARPVSTPFGLYDCDVPVDGATAVVVSAVETAADLPTRPVLVEAVGTQILERLSWDQDTLDHLPQSQGPAAHLWTRTDLRPTDVDVALLYDGFTFNAVSWLEGLGFCGPGEATDFVAGGKTIAPDGALPLNPHGGQLSAGRLHGYGFVREAMLQLRGQAGARQVPDARVAVVTNGGGVPSCALLLRSA
ncbi:thiolase C-terminal domain-containing protein [Cryptosporangium aurantiacum]|uniref:Acetyl-CoA acetyltransferase n=1 Tax=Cryptosporangium aurantiacum TaxID=134849 RepID=A0A1M7R4I2_9ACTN|nr:OB-fold domain-containing protein [Cryptosporangium aurantiacum]SHN40160.1 Acetyl-CoA acetyltransferase [Cryptosporangium aurantiacum]